MNIFLNGLQFLLTAAEIQICLQMMGIFFEKRVSGKKYYVLMETLTIAIAGILVINRQIILFSRWILLLTIILTFLSGFLLYRNKILTIFTISAIFNIGLALCDLMNIYLVSILVRRPDIGIFIDNDISFSRVLILLFTRMGAFFLYKHLKDLFERFSIRISYYTKWLLLLSGIGFIGVYNFQEVYANEVSMGFIADWFLFFALILMIAMIFGLYVMYRNEKENTKMILIRNQLLEDSWGDLNQMYRDNQKIFHDLKKHVNIMYRYMKSGKQDAAMEYMESIIGPVQVLNECVWSGNQIIDLILNYKKTEAIHKDIHMNCKVDKLNKVMVKDNDMCVILGNLLDNAIEACELVHYGKKWITVEISQKNRLLLIAVKNSMEVQPIKRNGRFETGKKDKKLHGLGMESIQAAADKYGGCVEYEFDDKKFQVFVTLFF